MTSKYFKDVENDYTLEEKIRIVKEHHAAAVRGKKDLIKIWGEMSLIIKFNAQIAFWQNELDYLYYDRRKNKTK